MSAVNGSEASSGVAFSACSETLRCTASQSLFLSSLIRWNCLQPAKLCLLKLYYFGISSTLAMLSPSSECAFRSNALLFTGFQMLSTEDKVDGSSSLSMGDPFECSSEPVDSSLARASTSGSGIRIDGIYNYATFGEAVAHLNCFEIESHSYCKNRLKESVAVIENIGMQMSWQSQPGDPRDISDLMDDEVRVCDTCGDIGLEHLLVICNKCTDGAEHIYCMRIKMAKVPEGDWTCEECMPRAGTGKLVQGKVEEATNRSGRLSENSINPKSGRSSKLKLRSSYSAKSETSIYHIPAKRCLVPLEGQSPKKARDIVTNAVPHISSEPCNDSPVHKDFSCKKFRKVKMKSVNRIIYSASQSSCNSQEKAKFPQGCGDKRNASTLEAELGQKGRALETRVQFPKASNPRNHSLLSREHPFKRLGRMKLEAVSNDTSLKQSSYCTEEKAESPHRLSDESPNLGLQTEIAHDECSLLESRSSEASDLKSKGQVAKDGCLQKQKVESNPAAHDDTKGEGHRTVASSVPFNSVISRKSNAACSGVLVNAHNELQNPAVCLLASHSGVTADKSEIETVSSGETLLSGPISCNLDAGQSSGQLNHRLQPSNHKTPEDPNCPNEKKKNESQQAEHPTKAAAAKIIHELCTGLALDERSYFRDLTQVEVAMLSQGFVNPKIDYTWQGKFLIHSSEGTAKTCDGIQAHLSTCASLKVLEVVDRLPEIIVLDELPRLRMWPSQFVESQATEENIALYFFAKDPHSYRTYYRRLMDYMTGNDLALKGNLNGVELLIFPSNILPEKSQRWNEMLFLWGVFRGRKGNNSANTQPENGDIVKSGAFDLNAHPEGEDDMARVDEIPEFDRPSGDRVLLFGVSSNDKGGKSSNDKGGKEKADCEVVDLNLVLWPEDATPEDGCEPSTALTLAPPSDLVPLELQVAKALVHLSRASAEWWHVKCRP